MSECSRESNESSLEHVEQLLFPCVSSKITISHAVICHSYFTHLELTYFLTSLNLPQICHFCAVLLLFFAQQIIRYFFPGVIEILAIVAKIEKIWDSATHMSMAHPNWSSTTENTPSAAMIRNQVERRLLYRMRQN